MTASITEKIIVYGPLIGGKQIRQVEKTARKVCRKSDGIVGRMLRGHWALVLFEKGTFDHHRYIKEVLPVALRYGNSKFGNSWTFQQDNRTAHTHQETQDWCSQHFSSFIDKDTLPVNSLDSNPLDYYIWDEFSQVINWNKMTSKSSLISEVKREVKKIRLYVVRESCSVWTNRLYRNEGNYLRG